MKSPSFPTVVRGFKIILSLARVVFTKAVDVKIQGTATNCKCTCFCNNVQASKYRSIGNTPRDFYRIVEAHDDKIFVRREK